MIIAISEESGADNKHIDHTPLPCIVATTQQKRQHQHQHGNCIQQVDL